MCFLSRVILIHMELGLKASGFSMADAALKHRSSTLAPDVTVAPDDGCP
jgi:hypothetical protein